MTPEEIVEQAFKIESYVTREQAKILFELAKQSTGLVGELGSWKGRGRMTTVYRDILEAYRYDV